MKLWTDAIYPLSEVCTFAQMKMIGVKIAVVASATIDVGHLKLKKKKKKKHQQKHEEMGGLVVFCQEV